MNRIFYKLVGVTALIMFTFGIESFGQDMMKIESISDLSVTAKILSCDTVVTIVGDSDKFDGTNKDQELQSIWYKIQLPKINIDSQRVEVILDRVSLTFPLIELEQYVKDASNENLPGTDQLKTILANSSGSKISIDFNSELDIDVKSRISYIMQRALFNGLASVIDNTNKGEQKELFIEKYQTEFSSGVRYRLSNRSLSIILSQTSGIQ